MRRPTCLIVVAILGVTQALHAQQITSAGRPAELDIRIAGERSVRVTLKPISFKADFAATPALADQRSYPAPMLSLRQLTKPVKKRVGQLNVEVRAAPTRVIVTSASGAPVQELVFENDGTLSFALDDQPVLGMGEGGPKPEPGKPWRDQPIQFDRRGRLDTMEPRWQSDAYGSRNPVAMLVGTKGWACSSRRRGCRSTCEMQIAAGSFPGSQLQTTTFRRTNAIRD